MTEPTTDFSSFSEYDIRRYLIRQNPIETSQSNLEQDSNSRDLSLASTVKQSGELSSLDGASVSCDLSFPTTLPVPLFQQRLLPFSVLQKDPTDAVEIVPTLIGLPNLMNNCYINSVIQLFLQSPGCWASLRKTFPEKGLLLELKKRFTTDFGESLTNQCDTSEFLAWLLDQCKEKEEWKLVLQYTYTCRKCKDKSIVKQPEECIYVYPQASSERVGLDTQEESEEDDRDMLDTWAEQIFLDKIERKCEKCGHSRASRKASFHTVGNNLFFIPVHIHKPFKIPKFCYIKKQKVKHMFKCTGFVVHTGFQGYGHYVAYVETENGWKCISDSTIVDIMDISPYLNPARDQQKCPYLSSIKIVWYSDKGQYDEEESEGENNDEDKGDVDEDKGDEEGLKDIKKVELDQSKDCVSYIACSEADVEE